MLDCGGTSASGVLGLERMGRNEDGRGYEMATANGWRIVAQMQNRLAARGKRSGAAARWSRGPRRDVRKERNANNCQMVKVNCQSTFGEAFAEGDIRPLVKDCTDH